jgi:hypothetical protein
VNEEASRLLQKQQATQYVGVILLSKMTRKSSNPPPPPLSSTEKELSVNNAKKLEVGAVIEIDESGCKLFGEVTSIKIIIHDELLIISMPMKNDGSSSPHNKVGQKQQLMLVMSLLLLMK